MEKRLTEQQIENEKERERLHSLLAKFERHISEKANELEKVSTNLCPLLVCNHHSFL